MLGIRQQAAEEEANARRLRALQEADRWNKKFAFDKQVHNDNIAEKGKDRESRENIAKGNNATKVTVAGMRKSGGGGVGGVGGVGSVGGGIPWYDKHGVLHYAKTEAEAKQNAKANGTYQEDYTTTTSKGQDSSGQPRTTTTTRASGWHSKKPEVKPQAQAKPQGKPQEQAKKAEVKPQAQAKPQGKTNGKGTVKETGVDWVITN